MASYLERNPEKMTAFLEEAGADLARKPSVENPENGGLARMIPRDQVRPLGLNTRTTFTELEELADSIRSLGILQAVIVRPIDPAKNPYFVEPGRSNGTPGYYILDDRKTHALSKTYDGDMRELGFYVTAADAESHLPQYELIAGERRWRAAGIAGLAEIPAVVRECDDKTAQMICAVENLRRADFDPIEEAETYARLALQGVSQAEIGREVGMGQSAVANRIRLLKLPEPVKQLLREKTLSVAHGVALARFAGFPAVCEVIAKLAVQNKASSKDLEKDIPWSWELTRAGIARSLDDYGTAFDLSVCKQCPFQAYRKNEGGGSPLCLKPEHYDQLQAEAQKALLAEAQRLTEQAKASGNEKVRKAAQEGSDTAIWRETISSDPSADASAETAETKIELLRLEKLGWGNYEQLRSRRPEGCTNDCPCYAKALDRSNRITDVCLDPARHKGLKGKATRTQNRERREKFEGYRGRIRHFQTGFDPGTPEQAAQLSRSLAVVAQSLLGGVKSGVKKQIAERLKPGSLKALLGGDHTRRDAQLEWLQAEPLPELIHLLAEAEMANEMRDQEQYGRDEVEITEWYLREKTVVPPSTECFQCSKAIPAEQVPVRVEGRGTLHPGCAWALGVLFCRECGCTGESRFDEKAEWKDKDLCLSCKEKGAGGEEAPDA